MNPDKLSFPPTGLTYVWFLNDACRPAHVREQIAAFAQSNVSCVCLHPRAGLLLPYGGDDWFAFVGETARACAAAGLQVWLYDEDPYPSGNAGGWVTTEHAEYRARAIQRFVAPSGLKPGELFAFPTGNLCWAGLVPAGAADAGARPIDLTGRVGIVRREWRILDPWDSRWYYPATPLYHCPRSETYTPEFALRVPAIPPGMQLEAFVAQPVGTDAPWGALHDSLNPAATRDFIARTHERYYRELGPLFGKEITAIFSDEAKYFGARPWTPGMFDGFLATFGYDLRPHLVHLFTTGRSPEAIRARLDYRDWCARRFLDAWLKPVAKWCRDHRLHLVGHISPEDDPVEQANCIGNLFPLLPHFALAGLDLIIPAVGDARHPIINIGIITATSVAQQTRQPGVMSESLGCSGLEITGEAAGRILKWQTAMGLTTAVVHGHFSSVEGPRLIDAPPDFGPQSSRWTAFDALAATLRPVQERLVAARQEAPVAVLWPIRSFNIETNYYQHEPGGRRGALADLLLACLARQVGVHLLDEADLWRARFSGGRLRLGRAAYAALVLPECDVLHARTAARLGELGAAGFPVRVAAPLPAWVQDERGLTAFAGGGLTAETPAAVVASLPRLLPFAGEWPELRCTVWAKAGRRFALLFNVGAAPLTAAWGKRTVVVPPGELVLTELSGSR